MSIRRRRNGWEVAVYLGRDIAGRRQSISRMAPTERKARALERQLLNERDEGRRSDGGHATVEHLIGRWLDQHTMEESTRYQARHRLERHVVPHLGRARIERVRPEDLDDLYRLLRHPDRKANRKPLAASSVARVHGDLRSVFRLAVDYGWIARNPVARAHPPSVASHEPAPPSATAVRSLIEYMATGGDGDDETREANRERNREVLVFVSLDAVLGARRGEVCALRRGDVDVDGATVRIARALGQGKGTPYVKPTKSGRRFRVDLDDGTIMMLRDHMKLQAERAHLAGVTVTDESYLFSRDTRGLVPWRPDFVTKRVAQIRAKVPVAADVRLRELRHFVATEGLEGGFSPSTVAARTGHARNSTLLDFYAGSVRPSGRALADHLARRLGTDAGERA